MNRESLFPMFRLPKITIVLLHILLWHPVVKHSITDTVKSQFWPHDCIKLENTESAVVSPPYTTYSVWPTTAFHTWLRSSPETSPGWRKEIILGQTWTWDSAYILFCIDQKLHYLCPFRWKAYSSVSWLLSLWRTINPHFLLRQHLYSKD